MAKTPGPSPVESDPPGERLRRAFLTGLALTIPLVLTLVVLQIALDLVSQAVAPIVAGFELVFGSEEAPKLILEVVTVLTLTVVVLVIGSVAERRSGTDRFAGGFDAFMERIPGLGAVYSGTRRMSEVLLEQDTDSFQEVKLVEFPRDGAFMIGFLTAEPPEPVLASAGTDEMVTLFVPLAPNPVMGGFLVNLPDEQVFDVDLTVEEGVQAVVTSGAAIDPRAGGDDRAGTETLADAEFLDRRATRSAGLDHVFGSERTAERSGGIE